MLSRSCPLDRAVPPACCGHPQPLHHFFIPGPLCTLSLQCSRGDPWARHCAVWTVCPASHGWLWIHHLIRWQGLPSAHGTASSHTCCRGQLTWGPSRGTSSSPGAWPTHCLPRTPPTALSPCRPGLDIPHGVKKCQPQCQRTRGTPFSHFWGSWSQ